MVYQFKPGSRLSADPQTAGRMCESLAANGGLTAKRLLDANREETAPLHDEFEWDDAQAAEHYREQQAGHIIRSLVVVREEAQAPPVRAFINVQEAVREYKPLALVVKSSNLSAQMIEAARRDLEVFRQKYIALAELAPVFEAMDAVFDGGRHKRGEEQDGTQ